MHRLLRTQTPLRLHMYRYFSAVPNSALFSTEQIVDDLRDFVQKSLHAVPNITREPIIGRNDPIHEFKIQHKRAFLIEHLGDNTFAIASNERIDIHDLSSALRIRCSFLPDMNIKRINRVDDHLIIVGTVHSGGGHDQQILKVYNWKTGELKRTLSPENGDVWLFVGVAGHYIIACANQHVVFWRIDDRGIGTVKKIPIDEYPRGTSFQILPNGNIALDCGNGAIHVWDLLTSSRRMILRGHIGDVHAMCMTKDGKKLIGTGDDRLITQWDIESGKCLGSFPTLCENTIYSLWSLGRKYVLGATKGELNMYDIQSGRIVDSTFLGGHDEHVVMLPTKDIITVGSTLCLFGKIERQKKEQSQSTPEEIRSYSLANG
jgi:WD40 repeat protein